MQGAPLPPLDLVTPVEIENRPRKPIPVKRIFFVANGMYGNHFGGGDLHFFEMARAATKAGYAVHFFGGHAFKRHWEERKLCGLLILTDEKILPPINEAKLPGQIALLVDHGRRFLGTLRNLGQVEANDYVYATSDYWFDVIPAVLCQARKKLLVFHMESPTLREIVLKARADVTGTRLASVYHWLSQSLALRWFRFCKNKQVLYLHPFMEPRLIRLGYRPSELRCISYGVDAELAKGVPEQEKVYDVVWIGRVHRQKGIDDLVQTLARLAQRVPAFRVILIGNLKHTLGPQIEALGLSQQVEFSGFVTETEKYRLFKASRVFVMPSRFEGSPRVIGEALACRLPVVAYDVVTYRPLFGDLLRYVPGYDVAALAAETEQQIFKVRAGENYLDTLNLDAFLKENSWPTTHERFCAALKSLSERSS